MLRTPPIITDLSTQYIYAVQWQKEDMAAPVIVELPNIQDAMQYVVGQLGPYINDIVFFSVTKRVA